MRHIIGDKIFLFLVKIFGKAFFSKSIETAQFEEHIAHTHILLPSFGSSGFYDVPVESLAGNITAGIDIIAWSGPTATTIIHHQGGGEIPYDLLIRKAYGSDNASGVNVIAVKTPFQSSIKELEQSFESFNNYVAMIASVVQLTEALVKSPELRECKMVVVSGYSLGGFVAARHHVIYNSADIYIPFVSGTKHAEIFLTTVKASKLALEQQDLLRSRLNFTEAWKQCDNSNVFPVLSRYDQLNLLAVQGPSYGDIPLEIWEGGHLYGGKDPKRLREIFDRHIDRALKLGESR